MIQKGSAARAEPFLLKMLLEVISKIADHAQGRDINRLKNGAYTLVCEYFKSVYNKALGR